MASAAGEGGNLDDILDRALDDFEEEEEVDAAAEKANAEELAAAAKAAAAAAKAAGTIGDTDKPEELSDMMTKLMSDMQKPEFQGTLEATMRELSGEGPTTGMPSVMNPFAGLQQGPTAAGTQDAADMDTTLAQTLQLMSGVGRDKEGVDADTAEAMGEEVMKKMMSEFEKMGEKEDFQTIVDGMMKQLLSKDVMYMPMKQICDAFPEWLADNESKLPAAEYQRFGKQYQYFQQLVAVYETEPDNFPRLMELMQDMQETGQPPAEIIKELAPGMQFTEGGLPMLPNMGPGMPGPPSIAGMPPGCSIM